MSADLKPEATFNPKLLKQVLIFPVWVAALGYLVDMYDLFLFSIVRIPSLISLGLSGEQLTHDGIILLDLQMAGLLLGGFIWGILGDKKGRLSVLFGSILIYSLANIGNSFVTNIEQYALLRFLAGIGLAGELGAGITLVAETLPKEIRGYGTTMVATLGAAGAVLAYFITDWFDWRASYLIGGVLGLLLLLMRVSVLESSIFTKLKSSDARRGNLSLLFGDRMRIKKYLGCVVIALPIWFVTGILITFSPEFGKALGLSEPVIAGKAVMLAFSAQVAGDLVSGYLSQRFQTRRKIMMIFMAMSAGFALVYLLFPERSLFQFYFFCACLGFCNGYWTLFVTVAAELFGTNLRATVATTIPNVVRGCMIPMTALFFLGKTHWGIVAGSLALGVIAFGIAATSLLFVEETHGKDLDYTE